MLWIKIFHMFTQIILWQKNSFLCIIKVLWLIIITIVNLSTTIKATLNLINCFLLFFKRKEVAYMSYSCLFYTLCPITIQFTIHCLLHSSTIYTSPFNLILRQEMFCVVNQDLRIQRRENQSHLHLIENGNHLPCQPSETIDPRWTSRVPGTSDLASR